ncbi:MAG: restriction endonuclease subunit S [Phycisphaerales bacterium]|nr:restriction endonuclease subunit S [Phycisphaerales bacterium]
MQSAFVQDQLRARASGTTVLGIRQSELRLVELPLPPFPEQRAIAGVLGALDDRVEVNRKTARVLEGIARAVFTSWFVDFDPVRRHPHARHAAASHPGSAAARRAPGPAPLPADLAALFPTRLVDSPIGEVPEGWRASNLGEVIEIHDSKRIPLSSQERAARPGPFRYYGAAGIVDHVDAYLFDGTYLLLGEDGSVVDDAGRPVVQYVWGQFWVNNHAHVLTGTRGFSIEHLYLLAQGLNVKPFVTGAVQPKISQGNLKAIPIVLAPEPVNVAFGKVIAPLFARLKVAHDQSATLAALRDALLPKLISGELRIADAEKIVGAMP